jgi:hypothetical protein
VALSVELISAIFTGLTGLLAALAAVLAQRSRRVSEDSRHIRRGYRELQKKFNAALNHIFALENTLAGRGIPIPPRPATLESDDDDEQPASARASA